MPEFNIKILPNGRILLERFDNTINENLYAVFSSLSKNSAELHNFLFQWEQREVLIGDSGLCG